MLAEVQTLTGHHNHSNYLDKKLVKSLEDMMVTICHYIQAQGTPPPLPVKQKSVADTNIMRTNDSPSSTPPRIPERRPSIAQLPVDMVNGKRNSTLSEEEEGIPPVPRRTVSVNKGRPDVDDSSSNTYAVVNKKNALESPKPPPIPRKKSTPHKVSQLSHVCHFDFFVFCLIDHHWNTCQLAQ